MRKVASLMMMLVLSATLVFAQNRVITGQVTDETGNPIPFASIKVKSGKTGVAADANGNFRIEVPNGTVLVISAAGSQNKEITVTPNQATLTVSLVKANTELSSVVVSALGVKRSAKSTPYAVQQISGDKLTQTREADITTGMAGKIAGLQVLGQSASKLGSNGVVRLRGVAGLGDRNAIYVVDGTILTNVSDINIDDVASVSVLKGPNATALYGQRAEGGVIVITTKKARKGAPLSVDLTSSASLDKVGMLPDYQNQYGGGGSSNFQTFTYRAGVHPAEWAALNGKKFPDYADDASWGPKFDGSEYIPWYAWFGGHSRSYKTATWDPQPDNIRNFYDNGLTSNTNLSVSKGGSIYSLRAGYNFLKKEGIVPYSDQTKHIFSTQFSVDIIKNLTFGVNANYSTEKINGDFNDTYSNQGPGSFNQWFHRDIDMNIERELVDLRTPLNTFPSWNMPNPSSTSFSTNVYKGNYWVNHLTWYKYYQQQQDRNRLFGDASLAYKIGTHFKVTGTYRLNLRKTTTDKKMPYDLANSIIQSTDYDVPRGTAPFPSSYGIYNFYKNYDTWYKEENAELIAQYNRNFGNFSVDVLAGGNWRRELSKDSTRMTSFGLKTRDVYSIDSSSGAIYRAGTYLSRKKVYSAFAKATIGYKDFLYLDLSGRQDFSSVLPNNKNGYFYPSVGVSYVFSDFVKSRIPALSYGKLRGSWAQIGTDNLGVYAINQTYFIQSVPFGNNPLVAEPNTIYDQNIQPTLNNSFEVGADLRFLKDRIGTSVTLFREVKTNDIVSTQVSSTSGYTTKVFNAGSVMRKGIEIEVNIRPIQTKNFVWDASFNWSTYTSIVKKIAPNQNFIQYANDFFGQTYLYNQEGQKWGQLNGNGIKRINGLPVLNNDGTYVYSEATNLGSILPDYTGGFFNSFSYKNFTLTAAFDFSHGGKFYSLSHAWGNYSGLYAATAQTNDKGMNVRDAVSQGGGVHVYGVDANGKPVDYYVEAQTYYRQNFDIGIAEMDVLDATYLKCREIALQYNVRNPLKIGKFVKRFNVSLFARNPFNIYTANGNFDPAEIAGGAGAYENGQLPGVRSYGATLKVGF